MLQILPLEYDKLVQHIVELQENNILTNDGYIKLDTPSYEGRFFLISNQMVSTSGMMRDFQNTIYMGSSTFAPTKTLHVREAYNLFDLLGDLGGVMEVILFVFGLFFCPMS